MDNAKPSLPKSQPQVEGSVTGRRTRQLDREILRLALPALGALIVEPLLTIADSAMVGHLGTAQLAGLTIGSTIMNLLVGVCIFLAYTTTALTSRRLGRGDRAAAIRGGIDGMWLAAGLGVILAVAIFLMAPQPVALMGGTGQVAASAITYIRWSAPGLAAMLVLLAATGTLRGLLDTKTPFIVATIGTFTNIALNAAFIYGLDMGVAGSGLGTSLSQLGMAGVLVMVVWRGALRHGVQVGPAIAGIKAAGLSGAPLVVRSVSLQFAMVYTVTVAAWISPAVLASHQIVKSVWIFAAFGLDAIAIAAQALAGHALGEADETWVRALLRRCLWWGVWVGVGIGVIFALLAPWLPYGFSTDPQVLGMVRTTLLVAAIFQPLAGTVYILDGVLIGANDSRYLAFAMLLCLAIHVAATYAVYALGLAGVGALVGLWVAYGGIFMAARTLTLGLRARGSAWMRQPETR